MSCYCLRTTEICARAVARAVRAAPRGRHAGRGD
eukprot:SAG31_NODE_3274_length_4475_cov_4.879799_4_plen_33_part_01